MTAVAPEKPERRTQVACDHCGLPVPRGLVDGTTQLQFCCHGCRTVYEMIHAHGLDDYYHVKSSVSADDLPAQVKGQKYLAFDNEDFQQKHCPNRNAESHAIDLRLEGVHCAACMWLVERLPRILPGVTSARLSLRDSIVRITWHPQEVQLSAIAQTLDRLGYAPHPAAETTLTNLHRQEERKQLLRLGVAGACAGNIMLIAVALYAGEFSGIEDEFATIFRWLSAGLGLVSLAWPGSVFFQGAWNSIATRTPNLDLPIALALGVGGIAGLMNVALGTGEIYFDSLAMLVFLLLVGRWFQSRQRRWANETVGLLSRLTPATCRLVRNGNLLEVTVDALQPGDLVEVLSGDLVPADGQIVEGVSSMNNALLTGESDPQQVSPGDEVAAGTQNMGGTIRFQVTATGHHTRAGQLMQLVDQDIRHRSPTVQLADRALRWFIPAVIIAASATFVVWLFAAGLSPALQNTVALLIVACPCALGLATPLTLAVAIGHAAHRGILIKNAAALEALARGGRMLLDKTGTLTRGQPVVLEWIGPTWLQPVVARLESHSTHPIAHSLVEAFGHLDYPTDAEPITNIINQGDGGLQGNLGRMRILVGSPNYLASHNVELPPHVWQSIENFTQQGESIVAATLIDETTQSPASVPANQPPPRHKLAATSTNQGEAGLFHPVLIRLKDQLEPTAPTAIQFLRNHDWHLTIASGDSNGVVQQVAANVGIDPQSALGELTPEQKRNLVQADDLPADNATVVVGDGVNDAAALAAADVGVAVRGGAEVSLAAADVYLSAPGLTPLVQLIQIARRTKRVLLQNLVIAFCYNATAIVLASLGWITPLVAAILMPVSSATVLASAFSVTVGGSETCPPSTS